jgi:hypothetical protein
MPRNNKETKNDDVVVDEVEPKEVEVKKESGKKVQVFDSRYTPHAFVRNYSGKDAMKQAEEFVANQKKKGKDNFYIV